MFLKRVVLGVVAVSCLLGALWVSHSVLATNLSNNAVAVLKLHKEHHQSDSSRD